MIENERKLLMSFWCVSISFYNVNYVCFSIVCIILFCFAVFAVKMVMVPHLHIRFILVLN